MERCREERQRVVAARNGNNKGYITRFDRDEMSTNREVSSEVNRENNGWDSSSIEEAESQGDSVNVEREMKHDHIKRRDNGGGEEREGTERRFWDNWLDNSEKEKIRSSESSKKDNGARD